MIARPAGAAELAFADHNPSFAAEAHRLVVHGSWRETPDLSVDAEHGGSAPSGTRTGVPGSQRRDGRSASPTRARRAGSARMAGEPNRLLAGQCEGRS